MSVADLVMRYAVGAARSSIAEKAMGLIPALQRVSAMVDLQSLMDKKVGDITDEDIRRISHRASDLVSPVVKLAVQEGVVPPVIQELLEVESLSGRLGGIQRVVVQQGFGDRKIADFFASAAAAGHATDSGTHAEPEAEAWTICERCGYPFNSTTACECRS